MEDEILIFYADSHFQFTSYQTVSRKKVHKIIMCHVTVVMKHNIVLIQELITSICIQEY